MNPQLDQDAVNLAKAIRQSETGGNFNAVGDKNASHKSYGAYQFGEDTWNKTASKYGISIPIKQATPEQQNEVAYHQIKEWKDKGYNPGQIASMWNAGESEPDAYTGKFSNGQASSKPGKFDVPAYAKSVATAYQTLKGGGQVQTDPNNPSSVPTSKGYNPKPFSNPSDENQFMIDTSGNTQTQPDEQPKKEGLLDKLIKRGEDANSSLNGTFNGSVDPFSGLIQTAGASAGAINDIAGSVLGLVNRGANFLTGGYIGKVENAAQDVVGQGVKTIADTDYGKTTIAGAKEIAMEHPTLTKDIGAVGNMVGAVGTLEGAGALKDSVGKVAGKAFAGAGEKAAANELGEVASRTIGGKKILSAAEDQGLTSPVKVLAKKEFTPAIENGRYVTKGASENLDAAISNIEENELQPLLEKANSPAVSHRIPLEEYRQQALAEAKDQLMDEGGINSLFDRIKSKYGDYPTLANMNEAKRIVSKRISEAAFGSDVQSAGKLVRSSLQKSVEDGASALGLGDVAEINTRMASLIKAQKLLGNIEGKAAKSGLLGKILREGVVDSATIAGGAIGNATGLPLAGPLVGRGIGGLISKVVSRKTVGGLVSKIAR